MKKILLALAVLAMVSGCASTRKNSGEGVANGITSETTADGSTAKVDSSGSFAGAGSDSGTIEGLQTVHFEYDKSTLTDAEQKKLEGNAAWLAKNANVKMLIEGHCDQRGSAEYNLSLGERRANTIKQMLVKLGVAASRLTTTSFGKEKLIATGDSESELAQNRRANFVPGK
ncbi:OmpA family protein [bacterium]|nr:OmpA family protein [bacterium]